MGSMQEHSSRLGFQSNRWLLEQFNRTMEGSAGTFEQSGRAGADPLDGNSGASDALKAREVAPGARQAFMICIHAAQTLFLVSLRRS